MVAGNGSRAQATSYALGTDLVECMGSASDIHYYDLIAPADVTGGYVQGTVTGGTRVSLYTGTATPSLTEVAASSPGTPTTFFLAVAPGQSYQLGIGNEDPFTGAYGFDLSTTYAAVPDLFEPNDTVATATPVAIGTPVGAYLFSGPTGGTVAETVAASDDYYRFAASAGTVTIRITDVPVDVAPRLTLFTPDGVELARVASGIKGGVLTMVSPALATAGDLVIGVSPWSAAPEAFGAGTALPAHFMNPYTLTLSQP